jgi:hypothetical protein
VRQNRVAVFVQGTLGGMHWSADATDEFLGASGNDFIVGGGGGVQIRINDTFDVKPQVDVWGANHGDGLMVRFLLGGVVKFGKK